jgi:hypothetical protein
MATFGVRSGSLDGSAAARIPLNHAAWANKSEQARTVAPTRQAGGHWFESSNAHERKPRYGGVFAFQEDNTISAVSAKCPRPHRRSSRDLGWRQQGETHTVFATCG